MRRLIRVLDWLLRRAYGVFEFQDNEACLLRVRVTRAPHTLHLPDGVVRTGAPVLELHLWNEHMPRMPAQGPDVAWAKHTRRMLIESLRALARELQHNPRLVGVQAVGGVTVFILPGKHSAGEGLLRRLGFSVFPYDSRLGRFGAFWENLYSWALMWAFSAASLRRRRFSEIRRFEIWMSVSEFLRRYDDSSPVDQK